MRQSIELFHISETGFNSNSVMKNVFADDPEGGGMKVNTCERIRWISWIFHGQEEFISESTSLLKCWWASSVLCFLSNPCFLRKWILRLKSKLDCYSSSFTSNTIPNNNKRFVIIRERIFYERVIGEKRWIIFSSSSAIKPSFERRKMDEKVQIFQRLQRHLLYFSVFFYFFSCRKWWWCLVLRREGGN